MKLDEMKKLYCPFMNKKCKGDKCVSCTKAWLRQDHYYCSFGERF